MNIGIDRRNNLFYEGSTTWGHAIWPSPVVTPAKFVFEQEGKIQAEDRRDLVGDAYIFREDSFDPIARIRRGRFYKAGDTQPEQWHVQIHPALPDEARKVSKGTLKKDLETFYGNPIWHKFVKDQKVRPLVLLGFEERFTVWNIISVEYISTGEDLVTLKACSTLGVLPQIKSERIPESHRSAVIEVLDTFADEMYRSAPVSVIHYARDTANQILLAYFDRGKEKSKDLGDLTNDLEKEDEPKVIAASAAKIIARLHARAKPVEKHKRALRDIRQQDAELAMQCIGVMLCELGWADWC